MKRLLALLVLLAALPVAVAATGAPAPAAHPLVGTWRYGDGSVRVVRHANGSYTGTVRSTLRFAACGHPAGERMWTLWGGNGSYSGRQLSFGPRPGCSLRVPLAASIRVSGRALELRVARRQGIRPGACGGLTDCFRLTRVGPAPRPAAPPAPPRPAAPAAVADVSTAGVPAGSAALGEGHSSSSAAGRITVGAEVTGSLLLVHTYTSRGDLVALRPSRVLVRRAGVLDLAVAVARSEAAGCAAGSTGTLALRDGGTDGADGVRIRVCGWDLRFANGARVAIAP